MRPYYPNGKRSRPTKGIEKMLRMYLLQIWFNLSDEGVEDAIYDSYAFRKFMDIDFMEEQVSDDQREKQDNSELNAAIAELNDVTKKINNGVVSETLKNTVAELEHQKSQLESSIKYMKSETPNFQLEHFESVWDRLRLFL